jgi:hypothetical protein
MPERLVLDWDEYAKLPVPANLEAWCFEVILASFPADEAQDIYYCALQYIGWLNSHPVKEVA